jgi:hypothetical protein
MVLGQSNQDVLIAGGSITLSGPSSDNVLQFTFSNASWSIMGNGANLPGPVTAVTVNNGNTSSIFAAGRCVFQNRIARQSGKFNNLLQFYRW